MFSFSDQIFLLLSFVFFIIGGVAILLVVYKNDQIKDLKDTITKMNRSFNELDEQAKLIVKTDLELNKAQEELDNRLNGLDALQKASRLISTTLDENEIFHRLNQSLMIDLNFEKNIVLIYDENKKLQPKVNLGFIQEEVNEILSRFSKDANLHKSLKEGLSFSSVSSTKQRREDILHIFQIEHFVLSPILTQNGIIGIIFLGNLTETSPVTIGDEEVVSILANQIGQSLENARLFEQVFRSSQALEAKVQDRTKELAQALEDVQIVSKTKSDFISAVSHELRTPLTSIKGYASILMSDKLGVVPDAVKLRLEKINQHSDNLVKMINDLLDIARIESGRQEMHFVRCNLKEIFDNIHDLLTPQLNSKNIQWALEIDPKATEVPVDRQQLERVIINLVGNAVKFVPSTKGTITIKTKLNDDQMVEIQVIDNGIGIEEKETHRLFEEFYRVENAINQNVKGTGLGLSLAKKIVEAHKGKIWVTSKVGSGTTFHFTVPLEHTEKVIS